MFGALDVAIDAICAPSLGVIHVLPALDTILLVHSQIWNPRKDEFTYH